MIDETNIRRVTWDELVREHAAQGWTRCSKVVFKSKVTEQITKNLGRQVTELMRKQGGVGGADVVYWLKYLSRPLPEWLAEKDALHRQLVRSLSNGVDPQMFQICQIEDRYRISSAVLSAYINSYKGNASST